MDFWLNFERNFEFNVDQSSFGMYQGFKKATPYGCARKLRLTRSPAPSGHSSLHLLIHYITDIILVQKFKNNDTYRIGAFTNNTQDSDAYFVKVIVLSGKCHDDCHNKNNENANYIKVPYGTNTPGQTICYRTQRPGLEQGFGEIESCAPQLTQTGHNALQLPYTIFGLGLAPNFLDYMFVNVTNATDSSRSHTWSQVSHTVA